MYDHLVVDVDIVDIFYLQHVRSYRKDAIKRRTRNKSRNHVIGAYSYCHSHRVKS